MIKVKERNGRQVIDVNCELITKTCDAMNVLEPVMFLVNKYSPEDFERFQRNVCDFIQELHTAFLKADEYEQFIVYLFTYLGS